MPANANLAPPGYYMLFILNGSGVPSIAKIINISQNSSQAANSTATLTGVVTNTSGAPLANASVSSGSASATTAPDGTYTLNNVTIDSSTVTAALQGYNNASVQITVTAGSAGNVPDLQLAPIGPGNITGTVTDSSGNAVQGASVTGAGLTTLSDVNGNYALNNIPGGSVTLVASAAGFSPATETVTATTGNTVAAPTIILASNLGNIAGKVMDAANTPVTGATVTFGGGTSTTDSTGSFTFTNIPAGTIQLVASANGFQSVTQNVIVVGGNITTANFTLAVASSAPGIVAGTVTNIQTHNVISGAAVKWNTTSVTSNSTGGYSISNVAGGSQTVTASANGYLPVSTPVNVNGETSTLNFQLATAGILSVKVVNSAGAVVSGAQVGLSGGLISTSLTGTTNTSGVYSSTWIPIGNYTVSSGLASETATVTTGKTTSITITQNSGPTTGTITGTVTTNSGIALSAATVSSGSISATTQADGTYSLANVPAGAQTVTASLTGYQTATQSVTVGAGGTSTANFSLTQALSTGAITGKITNISTGTVLSGATVKWGSMAVSTNTSGVYTISNVTSGSQTLTASANGFLARNIPVNVVGGATATLNIQLATAGMITVKAVNASGVAAPGATITIKGGQISTTVPGTTNASGTFSSSWIPIGTYTVTISESGHATQTKTAAVTSGKTTAVNFIFERWPEHELQNRFSYHRGFVTGSVRARTKLYVN